MIKQFIQGEDTDLELFGLIGHWVLSRQVHEQLGVAVTSDAGSVIVTEVVATQPLTSVAVNVYVPAPKLVAVGNI